MSINFNVTGAERKALVGAISEILGKPAVYQYTPSYAYMVGDCTVDKNGAVSMPDSDELTRLATALAERSYASVEEECPDIDQHNPGQYANPDAPITEEMARQVDEYFDGYGASANDTPEAEITQADNGDAETLAIEMPLDGFTPEKLDVLTKLVESKATLIKKALGADTLPVQVLEDRVRFPWFTITGVDGEADAYMRFVAALCKMAKEQKRITAKDKNTDNEKFSMRIFLIRLGFVGPEFRVARKILLSNLTGNSSWRSGQRPERVPAEAAVEEPAEEAEADEKQ